MIDERALDALFRTARTQNGFTDRLAPALSPGNLDKTMQAPATAIIAYDSRFYEHLPRTFPNNPAAKMNHEREEKRAHVEGTTLRNSSLQGAFFLDGRFKSNFLTNLGYGDPSKVFPRNPRFDFDEACTIA